VIRWSRGHRSLNVELALTTSYRPKNRVQLSTEFESENSIKVTISSLSYVCFSCFVTQVNIENHTIADWCQFLRDVCSNDLLANPQVLGGPGHTVAIDDSVIAKRKPGNAQGRPVPQQWVFGGVDLVTKNFFMQLVPARDAATLIPIIQQNILPGTTIWSDEWAAYNGLGGLGYVHQTVNHSQMYVDPVTGCHTNNIESRWNACQ
jgi:hypothetical protein